jgi:hypothetical protein
VLYIIQLTYEIGKLAILGCLRDAIYYIESQAPIKDTVKSIDGIIKLHLAAENFKYNISLNSLYKYRSAFH